MNWGAGMKPTHSLTDRLNGRARRRAAAVSRTAVTILLFVVLTACEQNSFVPPPPPKVEVGVPVKRTVTRFLEATGNTAPIKSVDLVARCGVLTVDQLPGRQLRKQGTTLFTIEPETYKRNQARRPPGPARGATWRLGHTPPDGAGASRRSHSRRSKPPRPPATTPRPVCSRPRPTPCSDQLRLHHASRVRRHRQRASRLGRRTRRRSVATQLTIVQLIDHVNQRQRTDVLRIGQKPCAGVTADDLRRAGEVVAERNRLSA